MQTLTMVRRLVATAAATTMALTMTPAAADDGGRPGAHQEHYQFSFVDQLHCVDDRGLFLIHVAADETVNQRAGDGRYHENSHGLWRITAVPVTATLGEEVEADDIQGREGTQYAGNLTWQHTANDGSTGRGHAVSSYGVRLLLEGEDGSRHRAHYWGHISATARPDDPEAFVRAFFSRAECR